MKKTYPTSDKAKEWASHLKPDGKRRANKSTRRIMKDELKNVDDSWMPDFGSNKRNY